jgi:hypothetical protein
MNILNHLGINMKAISVLTLIIGFLCHMPISAVPNLEDETKFADKVKREILKLRTGPDTRIAVKLRDKTKISGYLSEADNGGFVVVNDMGSPTKVLYPQVKKVKGNNFNTGAVIGIAAVAFIVIWIIVFSAKND